MSLLYKLATVCQRVFAKIHKNFSYDACIRQLSLKQAYWRLDVVGNMNTA